MEKSHLKSPEWWTSLLGNIISLSPGGIAVDLSKLLKIYVTPSAKYRSDKEQDDQKTIQIPNLIESLLETIETSRSSIIIHGQPGHGKNTVLILDGLDERLITDGSDYALQGFIRNMFALSDRINKQENSRLNLILTGRSQFVKGIQSAFTSDYHLFEIEDFSQDQVERWLEKYCKIKQIDPPITYQNFTDRHLQDLIHQPILLTVSAMMLADKDGQKLIGNLQGTISRGDIYRTIITWTYQRKWQCHPNCAALPDEASYRQFLRIPAFVLFRHGEEKIEISTLIDTLKQDNKLYDLEIVKNNSDESIKDICRHLAVSFFFRGLEENAFSFIHKSIKDYLIAEAIFELLKEAAENFKPKKIEKSCDDMAADIYFILGKSGLHYEDHIPFLKDIIASQKEAAKEIFKPLEAFFKMAQGHTYLIEHKKRQNDNPLKTEANVLSGLLYMLTNIFHSLSEDERKEFYKYGDLNLFKNRKELYVILYLLKSTDIDYRFNFDKVFLQTAYLRGADLSCADLRFANLVSSDLSGTNLKGAIGLTHEQLKDAITDATTILPDYLKP